MSHQRWLPIASSANSSLAKAAWNADVRCNTSRVPQFKIFSCAARFSLLNRSIRMDIAGNITPSFNDLLQTYSGWSSPYISSFELAAHGFAYSGYGDRVQCVIGGCNLHSWCEGDKPAIEHRKHFPNCPSLLDNFSICRICLNNERDTLTLPCFHLVMCSICKVRVTSCPICRSEITGSIKVFMA